MEQYTKAVIVDFNDVVIATGYLTSKKDGLAIIELEKKDKQTSQPASADVAENSTPIVNEDDDESPFYLGRFVKVKVFDNTSGVHIYKGIVSYYLSELVHIDKLELVDRIQRRNDVKLFVNFTEEIVPITIKMLGKSKVITKKAALKKLVEIRDISAGGFCFDFNSPVLLDQDTLYQTEFKKGRVPIDLTFKILRVIPHSATNYTYGCQFVDLSARNEEIIREFIFKNLSSMTRNIEKQ